MALLRLARLKPFLEHPLIDNLIDMNQKRIYGYHSEQESVILGFRRYHPNSRVELGNIWNGDDDAGDNGGQDDDRSRSS